MLNKKSDDDDDDDEVSKIVDMSCNESNQTAQTCSLI